MANLARRAGRKISSVCGAALHHGKTAWLPVAWRTRRLLARTGAPIRKQFLVVPCLTGTETSGLFTEFLAVLGALAHYQRWPELYSGLTVDYQDHGLYYDPARGRNWWQYYFEPIAMGTAERASLTTIDPHLHDLLTYHAAALPRAAAHALIARHVRLRSHLAVKLEDFVAGRFTGTYVIGLHYRGTDKHEEAPAVPYEVVAAAVRTAAAGAGDQPWRVFVATDDQRFLDFMIERFPDRLLYRPMFRSSDGRPIDVTNDDSNYQKGEDAVLDCLLLSRTSLLIRTASNLSLCSTFFNADVTDRPLNRPYYTPRQQLW